MPSNRDYRRANTLMSDVLGADAADQREALAKSVEQIARLFELTETYQDHTDSRPSPNSLPHHRAA